MLGQSITKNSLILGAFAAATAALIALTFERTEARITAAEKKAAQKALFEIVPPERHDNDMLANTITIPTPQANALGLQAPAQIHIAENNGELVAFIVPASAPDGYSGAIKMIVGVNADGSVAGVRILSHKETPGLGDKVDLNKSDWVLSFNGKSLQNPTPSKWRVKKDGGEFDQFTGATITPRAVVRQVQAVLQFIDENREALAEQAKTVIAEQANTQEATF